MRRYIGTAINCVRVTGKPQRQVVILQTVSCETGVIAFSTHGSRPCLFIRNAALIREFMQPTISTPHTDLNLSEYPWRLYDQFHRSLFNLSLMRTSPSSIERNLIFAVKREDESSLMQLHAMITKEDIKKLRHSSCIILQSNLIEWNYKYVCRY